MKNFCGSDGTFKSRRNDNLQRQQVNASLTQFTKGMREKKRQKRDESK